jgi:exodeoxyribonuclease VII small subunit
VADDDGMNDPAALGYETARDELAEVVRMLETGGLSLEDSLALWERGEQLAAACERHLAGARERIESVIAAREQRDAQSPPIA